MVVEASLELKIRTAAERLFAAQTADDVRKIWREELGLGHRVLGRLLIAKSYGDDLDTAVKKILDRKEK